MAESGAAKTWGFAGFPLVAGRHYSRQFGMPSTRCESGCLLAKGKRRTRGVIMLFSGGVAVAMIPTACSTRLWPPQRTCSAQLYPHALESFPDERRLRFSKGIR